MLHKGIKSIKEAAKVARAMAKDLRQNLAIYESYKVSVEEYISQYNVTVTSPEGYCNILTGACISGMMEIIKMYELQYQRISYHMEVVQTGEKHIPAFTVCINYDNNE